jgi:hypothetical protein
MKPQLAVFVDSSVYKPTQEFRLLGSAKLGSGRYKTHLLEFKKRHFHHPRDPIELFRKSLVSLVDNCITFGQTLVIPEKPTQSFDDISDEQVSAALTFLNGDYEPGDQKGNLIALKLRDGGGYCPIHKRIHESENAFLVVKSNGNVVFGCHRDREENYRNSMVIGSIQIDYSDKLDTCSAEVKPVTIPAPIRRTAHTFSVGAV